MMKKIFLKLLFFAFAILSMNLHASHYQGLDIFYDCLGNNQYKITIKTYRDCGSTVIISLPGTVSGLEINFQSSTCLQPTLVTPWSEVSLKEVSLFCGNIQTKCSNPLATLNGVQEQVFEAVYDFTGLNCPIVFSASQCCRNSIITNITQPGVRFIYSEITINNSLTNCNSSPRFENLPVNYVCLGNYFAFKQKAIDPDGDSLVYRLSNCLGGTTNANDTVAYVTPQSAQQPILSNSPLIINPSTGDITFTPSSIQVSVLCLFVDEYRNGVLIGTIERDIQIGVINCTEFIPMSVNCTFYNDFDVSCVKDSIEKFIINMPFTVQPGNLVFQTISDIDSLPIGNYTATVDTSGQWKASCSPTVNFTVTTPDSILIDSIGMININPCVNPEISIFAPKFNPCFSNNIYVKACNLNTSFTLDSVYADIKLDSFLTINSSTRSYTSLGNNSYRFSLNSLYPGNCLNWVITTTVSCAAQLGRTLTLQANLYPVAPCVLDSTPNMISGVAPCLTTFDNSHLVVNGSCSGDSIRFVIKNTGSNMDCFMPTRMFLDNVLQNSDSVKLNTNDSLEITFLSDGRTWRLETEQHPLHPGNSHPNATVEACGDSALVATNWTSGLVATMPQDDADPVVDIYCGVVSGSFDPNDKTGYPNGVDFGHYILPNQQMQYVIRFQNTGTDTAFKVVIRDTLETDLNIFSVVSGVSSHNNSFRMYGPRILEWTFYNIMLPDSFHSEPNSHGFVTFFVEQNENLPSGTSIDNSAAIYFDFNAPIITNVAHHEIQRELLTTGVDFKVAKGDVLVYPNPNNGFFKMELPSSMPSTQQKSKITICNVMGQVVYILTPLNGQSTEIDLSKHPNGIYFLKVENGGMEWNKKVVKN